MRLVHTEVITNLLAGPLTTNVDHNQTDERERRATGLRQRAGYRLAATTT
jgi:hypothetical protein